MTYRLPLRYSFHMSRKVSKKDSKVVINFNVYNEDQLIDWAQQNTDRPVIFARVNPHVKSLLDALVALQDTTKANYIERLVTSAVMNAAHVLRSR